MIASWAEGGGDKEKEGANDMRHLWRHILALIAVVTGGAVAVMNVLGSFGAFADREKLPERPDI